jgi:hypothetical protein
VLLGFQVKEAKLRGCELGFIGRRGEGRNLWGAVVVRLAVMVGHHGLHYAGRLAQGETIATIVLR